MKTYLILKEKAAQWNADKEIQSIVAEINADDGSMNQYFSKYSTAKAYALKAQAFDRNAVASRGLKYERLDQLTMLNCCWGYGNHCRGGALLPLR